ITFRATTHSLTILRSPRTVQRTTSLRPARPPAEDSSQSAALKIWNIGECAGMCSTPYRNGSTSEAPAPRICGLRTSPLSTASTAFTTPTRSSKKPLRRSARHQQDARLQESRLQVGGPWSGAGVEGRRRFQCDRSELHRRCASPRLALVRQLLGWNQNARARHGYGNAFEERQQAILPGNPLTTGTSCTAEVRSGASDAASRLAGDRGAIDRLAPRLLLSVCLV